MANFDYEQGARRQRRSLSETLDQAGFIVVVAMLGLLVAICAGVFVIGVLDYDA